MIVEKIFQKDWSVWFSTMIFFNHLFNHCELDFKCSAVHELAVFSQTTWYKNRAIKDFKYKFPLLCHGSSISLFILPDPSAVGLVIMQNKHLDALTETKYGNLYLKPIYIYHIRLYWSHFWLVSDTSNTSGT